MRLKLLLVFAALLVLAVPATASAALKVGMSENNPQIFADPNYLALDAKITRIVVAYDAATEAAKGDNEISARVKPYIDAATALGIDVLVTFEHSRGNAEICKKSSNRDQQQCKLPSVEEYEQNIAAFLALFPQVTTIAAWNEANHNTQPTYRNGKTAGQFAKSAEKVCEALGRDCTIVALDLLDQADNVRAKRPTYKSLTKYVKAFRKAYGKKPAICGLHTYSDANRFRDTGTKAMIKATGCKKYWVTESGGLYDFASFWSKKSRKQYKCKSAAACQLKATKYLFKLLSKYRSKIDRAYIHSFYGSHAPRFDAGIVKGGPGKKTTPRPAYREVKKHT
jgi:hypothetical protein